MVYIISAVKCIIWPPYPTSNKLLHSKCVKWNTSCTQLTKTCFLLSYSSRDLWLVKRNLLIKVFDPNHLTFVCQRLERSTGRNGLKMAKCSRMIKSFCERQIGLQKWETSSVWSRKASWVVQELAYHRSYTFITKNNIPT